MEARINSQMELYNRVKPALRTKRHELIAAGIKYITEKDIWDYNRDHKWKKDTGLTLASMVDDILNTDNSVYQEEWYKKMNSLRLQGDLNG